MTVDSSLKKTIANIEGFALLGSFFVAPLYSRSVSNNQDTSNYPTITLLPIFVWALVYFFVAF